MTSPTHDSVRQPDRRAATRPEWLAATAIAAWAVLVALAGTRSGSLVGIDSAAYLAGARNLAAGAGYAGIDQRPITLFPPGFSATVAIPNALGIDAVTAARTLNAVALGIVCLLTFVLARRHARRRWTPVVACGAVAVMPAMFGVFTAVWSEPVFCVLTLAFILALEPVAAGRAADSRLVALAAVAAGVAYIFRYAGVALIVAGIVVVALTAARDGRWSAARRSGLFAAIALIGPVVVTAINLRHGTIVGPRAPSAETFTGFAREGAATLRGWVVGTTHDQVVLADVVVVVVVVAILVAAARARSDRPSTGIVDSRRFPLTAIVGIYVGYLVLSEFATAIDPVGDRLLSPVIGPIVVLVACALESYVDHPARLPRAGRLAILGAVVVVWFAGSASITISRAVTTTPARNGYAAGWWTHSGLVDASRRLPAGATIVSNNAAGLYLATGRQPLLPAPTRRIYRSSGRPLDIATFRTRVARVRQPVFFVWERLAGDTWDVTPAQLTAAGLRLAVVHSADFGTIFRLGT